MNGYELEFIDLIASNLEIPVIACGGAGSLNDFNKLFTKTKASAGAAGSLFVFNGPRKAVLISYFEPEMLSQIV
jgi:cyclase